MLSSLWVSRTGSASDWCVLQEALYKCIDTIQYNTVLIVRTKLYCIVLYCIRAQRRRQCVGGGATVNFGRRRAAGKKNRRRRGRSKMFFQEIQKKFRSILRNKPFHSSSFRYRLTYIDRYVINSGCVMRMSYFYPNQSRRLKM